MTPETAVKRAICSYLRMKGIFFHTIYNGATFNQKRGRYMRKCDGYSMNGIPDILGTLPGGRTLAIEVKSKTGRLSPEQKVYLDTVNKLGGLAFMARSIDDVQRELEKK